MPIPYGLMPVLTYMTSLHYHLLHITLTKATSGAILFSSMGGRGFCPSQDLVYQRPASSCYEFRSVLLPANQNSKSRGLIPRGPIFSVLGSGGKPVDIDRLYLHKVPGLRGKGDNVQQVLPGRQGKGGCSVRRKGAWRPPWH